MLVDDERPSLRVLEILLKDFNDISVVGAFTNPREAIEKIEQLKPDAVFLDINMPQLQGIDAASAILERSPDTDIIFVTAFDQYAVEAFELNALDYILKPVNIERLRKTVERLIKKAAPIHKSSGRRLQIKCLGRFEIAWEGGEPIKWRAEKTKELFAFLMANEAREFSKDELLEALWMDAPPDRAIKQLYNGIYYIRKTLKEYGIARELIGIGSNYCMKLGDVDYDVKRFDALTQSNEKHSLEALQGIEQLYVGDYLAGEYYEWAYPERERLSSGYHSLLLSLSEKLLEEKRWSEAENCLLKAYDKNPYDEQTTELILNAYLSAGRNDKAVRHYHQFSELVKKDLNIPPSEKIAAMIKR